MGDGRRRRRAAGMVVVLLAAVAASGAPARAQEAWDLRVCADPSTLPYSDQRQEGFENKLAELAARKLGARLSYHWFPQSGRMGTFLRESLREGRCDVVMGIVQGYPLLLTTRPYYRSTYVFVTRTDRHLNVRSFDDPLLKRVRIGVEMIGFESTNTPPVQALGNRGIRTNLVPYHMLVDYGNPYRLGTIVDAVATGEVDVAVVWGPIAGYFAKRERIPLDLVPVSPAIDAPMLPMVYSISMGVRRGDDALRDRLDRFIEANQKDIDAILREYGVPLLSL
jgi:mxaJ protein